MFDYISNKTKNMIVTMRFSILAIFISLFVLCMGSMIVYTYTRLVSIMTYVAFEIMKKASSNVFHEVVNEIHAIEVQSQFGIELIRTKVVDPKNAWELIAYTSKLLQLEADLFPSIQSVFWANTAGSFIFSGKENDGSITTKVMDRDHQPHTSRYFYRDLQGELIRTENSNDFSYDPRIRPWWKASFAAKKMTATDVYPFVFMKDNTLGITIAAPLYQNGKLLGMFGIDLRLDYIRRFIENLQINKRGFIFIVSETGKVVAFPHIPQLYNKELMDVHALKFPAIVQSFDEYQSAHQQEFVFKYQGDKYIATYQTLPPFGSNHWLIGVVIPESAFVSELQKISLTLVIVSLILLILGLLGVSKLVTLVVRPLKNLVKQTEKIKQFELEEEGRVNSRIKEIMLLSNSLEAMKQGLRSFKKYVPAALVRQLIEAGEDARVGGTKRQLAIFFSDIKNFTGISEIENPNQLMEHVCEYLDELSHIIIENRGTIDKYIGDSIMAFWGAPLPESHSCEQAAIAAIHCVRRLKELNRRWRAEGKPAYMTRIGLHLGEAIVGNLGSAERLSYTAIGDAINVASRLEGLNKLYGTQIIVSRSVFEEIKHRFVLRMLDCVAVKGKTEGHFIYELMTEDEMHLQFNIHHYRECFAKGFQAYKEGNWDDAIAHFSKCVEINVDDTVAPLFIYRCEHFKVTPPSSWDGVWHISEK